MSPYEKVELLYAIHPQQYTLHEDLRRFSKMGYVFSTPKSFLMGYHVPATDTWFIHAMAGDLLDSLKYLPHKAEWVEFYRHKSLRGNKIVRFDSFRKKIAAMKHQSE